jgi:antitoxin YefM
MERIIMIAIKTADLTQDFRRIATMITGGEKVIISRPRNENLVIISEKDYNELERLRQNAQYLSKLDESLNQAKKGEVVKYSKKQMRAMEVE